MGEATITLKSSDDGAEATVTVNGSVTIDNSADLLRALSEAVKQCVRVALDLGRLEEVDINQRGAGNLLGMQDRNGNAALSCHQG